MEAELVNLSQDVSLETGDVTHVLTLRLPTGKVIQAVISDTSAAAVAEAKGIRTPRPVAHEPPPPAPLMPRHVQQEYADSTFVFGDSDYVPVAPGPPPAPPPPQPPPPARPQVIGKNEAGWPIFAPTDAVDPSSVLGGEPFDDGVSSA